MEYKHVSVLRDESIEGLNVTGSGIYVDGTLGGAGHTVEICKLLTEEGRMIGIDQDAEAIANGEIRLAPYKDKVTLVRSNFSRFTEIMDELQIEGVDGVLLDLGVSSRQLDEGSRGFSYMQDAPLDMRMDQRQSITAADVVNTYSEEAITRIIRDYGEERWAKRISQFIVQARKEQPIETTGDLVSIIKKAVPKGARQDGPHPAKRTFQAIRIEVNGELRILEQAIRDMVERLKPGGRLCIITFHSLEDRIVKQTMKELENPCTCPKEFPVCVCGRKPKIKIVTRKPIVPDEEELEVNPRSRSAKLRIAERI